MKHIKELEQVLKFAISAQTKKQSTKFFKLAADVISKYNVTTSQVEACYNAIFVQKGVQK